MINYNKYLQKGIFYTTYLEKVKNDILEKKPLFEYSELNIKRMERLNKTFHLTEDQAKKLNSLDNNFSILIISEGWCGDASQILPIINAIANELRVEMRIVFRDENEELMEQYLTNSSKSIPIIIIVDTNANKEIAHWGPRPMAGKELLRKHKESKEQYDADVFHIELQKYYNTNKGEDIFNEFIGIL